MADAKRYSNSRITTSGITLLGTTPSPSVYVHIFSRITHLPFLSVCPVRSLAHHLVHIYQQTDDILPFRNSILGEYALLMAPKPVGLGLTESEIETVARMGMESRFPNIPP
jgi:hypothetical protein